MQMSGPGNATQEERNLGMLCHLLALSGFIVPFGNIIGPLILWILKKDESIYLDDHGRECLNFQISMTIWQILCIPLWFVCVGMPLSIALLVVSLVCTIIAAVKANAGEYYRYPITIRFLS